MYTVKASLKILLRDNYTTKDGKRQVCLRYTAYRQCTFIGLNISVEPCYWSEKRCAVLSGDNGYSDKIGPHIPVQSAPLKLN